MPGRRCHHGCCWNPDRVILWNNGRVAQRLEHLLYTQRVGGSNPSAPTSYIRESCLPDPSVDVIFCDAAVNNGKWNLIGVFDRIHGPAFPFTYLPFWAYLNVSDLVLGAGVTLRLELRDTSVDSDGNMQADLLWGADVPISAGGPAPGAISLGFAIPLLSGPGKGLTFPKPGQYEFAVLFQGDLIDVTILHVVEARTPA